MIDTRKKYYKIVFLLLDSIRKRWKMDFLMLENRNWCWNIVFWVVRIRENRIFNENREVSI